MSPQTFSLAITAKPTLECGVCGREKVNPDHPDSEPCMRLRPVEGGDEPCTGWVMHDDEQEAHRG